MLTCYLQLRKKQCPFLMPKLCEGIKKLPHLFTVKKLLMEFPHILRAFYNLLVRLVGSTHSLIDASLHAQAGLNETLNYFF